MVNNRKNEKMYNIKCKNCGKEEKVTNSSFNLCESCYNQFNNDIEYYWLHTNLSKTEIAKELNTNITRIGNRIREANLIRIFTVSSLPNEVWKPYHEIYVSNMGRACKKVTEDNCEGWKLCTLIPHTRGYLKVTVNGHKELLHRVIIKAFVDIKNDTFEVHHINGIVSDNRLDNLKVIYDRKSHVEKHALDISKGRSKKIIGINDFGEYIISESATKLNREYPQFSQSAIQKCCNNIQNTHKGYHWFYINDGLNEHAPKSEHYQKKVQPLDIIEAFDLNFNMASALKYIARSKFKHQEIDDIDKAIYYLEREKNKILYK